MMKVVASIAFFIAVILCLLVFALSSYGSEIDADTADMESNDDGDDDKVDEFIIPKPMRDAPFSALAKEHR